MYCVVLCANIIVQPAGEKVVHVTVACARRNNSVKLIISVELPPKPPLYCYAWIRASNPYYSRPQVYHAVATPGVF